MTSPPGPLSIREGERSILYSLQLSAYSPGLVTPLLWRGEGGEVITLN